MVAVLDPASSVRVHEHGDPSMGRIPLAALVAATAAILDLGLGRVAPFLFSNRSVSVLSALVRWSRLPQNVAALASLVALVTALTAIVTGARYGPWIRRVGIAGFAMLVVLIGALATLLPKDAELLMRPVMTRSVLLLCIAATNVVCVLVGLSALRYAGPRGLRIGLALATASTFCSFAAVVASLILPAFHIEFAVPLGEALWMIGERAFLVVPVAVTCSILGAGPSPRDRIGLIVAVLAFAATVVALWLVRVHVRGAFPALLADIAHVKMFLDEAPVVVLSLLALPFATGTAALVAGSSQQQQAGLALWLWCAAGYAPPTTGRLLYMTLAMVLLARASFAGGDALIAQRRSLPTPLVRSSSPSFPPPDGVN